MRTSVAVLLAVVIVFMGVFALSIQSDRVADTALSNNSTNATSDAYNTTNGVFEGVLGAMSPALVWMGAGAIILVSLGVLVGAHSGGR